MRRSKSGFTLVELLIVIAIIAVLAVAAGGNYLTSLKRGRNTGLIAEVKKVQDGFEQYFINHTSNYGTSSGACAEMLASMAVFPGGNPIAGNAKFSCSNNASSDTYCLCAQLEPVGSNDYTGANSSDDKCTFSGTPKTYYCVVNLQ